MKLFIVSYEYMGAKFQTVIRAKSAEEALKHFWEFAGGAGKNPRIVSDQAELALN